MTLSMEPAGTADALAQLRGRLAGLALLPGDDGYDAARQPWNLAVDQRPTLVVVARGARDVAEAVRYANAQGLELAVQATGHGVIRPADGCLLVVTAPMNAVRVDAAARTAWVEAGAKWGQVLAPAQAVGLAPLLGSSPEVGAVGYTLGGGLGWLVRQYGLSADSVNAFEIVTADGQPTRASASQNPDLFWALRGGGGGFGVVTGMEIRLYPVTTVYGGTLFYPVEKARAVYAHYREWIASAPPALTSSIVLMNFPPLPVFPETLRGRSFVMVRGVHAGPAAQGEALLQHWRAWQAPEIDDFRAMPFSQVAAVSNDPVDPLPGLSSGAWLADLSDEVSETLVRYTLPRQGPPPIVFAEVRHVGGAMADVGADSAAFSHRHENLALSVTGITPSAEARAAVAAHIAEMKRALRQHLTGGVYLNFLEGEEARALTRQGYSDESYQRLCALKTRYDPQNRLSRGYALEPLPSGP